MARKEVLNLSREKFKELEDRLESMGGTSIKIDYLFSRRASKAIPRRAIRYAGRRDADAIVIGVGGYELGGSFAFPLGWVGSFAQADVKLYKFKNSS